MAHLRLGVALEAKAGFLKQFTGHAEVALGGADIDVSKIRCQLRQQFLDVRASAIPSDDSMDGRSVTNIVDAWLVSGGHLSPNPGGSADSAEQFVHTLVVQMNACACCKEG
jgi:hypothetical protein